MKMFIHHNFPVINIFISPGRASGTQRSNPHRELVYQHFEWVSLIFRLK